MRPIQRYGASPEGLQQHLYSVSRDGRVHVNHRMEAMCYGTTLPRYQAWFAELVATGRIVDQTPGADVTLRRIQVAKPRGWEDIVDVDAPVPEPPPAVKEETPGPDEDFDYSTHDHPRQRGRKVELVPHTHAWGSMPHAHILRAVCTKEECIGYETHNVHPEPEANE